ncbi:MAG: hypothetical protein U1F72_12685 [Gammaproteobacteria bacterium]
MTSDGRSQILLESDDRAGIGNLHPGQAARQPAMEHEDQPAAGLAPGFSGALLALYQAASGDRDFHDCCTRLAMALGCRWAALVRLAADGDGSGEVFGLGTPQGSGSPETSGIVGQLHVLSAAGGVLQGLPDGTPLVFLTDPDTADPGGERLQGVAVLDRKHRHPIVLCFGTSVLPGSRSRLEQDVLQLMPHLRQMLVLRDTAEQYRLMARMSIAIFNRAPNALIALAPDGTVAYLNEPARQLLAAADGMKLAGTRLSVSTPE